MNNEKFNNNMFKLIDICEPNSDKNIIVSGLSIKMAFAMLLNGAEGKSEEELINFLGKNREELNEETKRILSECGETLKLADAFWIAAPNQATENYKQIIKEYQNAEIVVDDFSSSETVEKINNWVFNNTNGLINSVVSEDNLRAALSIIINTLYFKDQWVKPFDVDLTYDSVFKGINKTSDIKMMKTTTSLYFENEYAKGFNMYYENSPYEFIAILPNDEGEFKLEELDLNNFSPKEGNYSVNVDFPKLDISFSRKLKKVVKSLGVVSPFENSNDFISMLSIPQQISEIIHKTRFKLDENGTEAAAVTAIISERGISMQMETPIVINLVFDRPFAFLIRHRETKDLLFTGKIYNL